MVIQGMAPVRFSGQGEVMVLAMVLALLWALVKMALRLVLDVLFFIVVIIP